MITVLHGDCLAILPTLAANSLDSCVIDPPYGLEFMGKEWDSPWKYGMRAYGMTDTKGRRAGPSFSSSRNPMCRACHKHKRGSKNHIPCTCELPEFDELDHRLRDMRGFQVWCEAWAREVHRVLKPGAHLLAFGGTRTYHRMVCAIEDAGFEIRDTTAWLYGSGFPKSHDISKAIDRKAGAERETIPTADPVRRMIPGADQNKDGWIKDNGREYVPNVSDAVTEAAKRWEGWGTALKPAMELICVARKPLSESTIAANVIRHGTGGLNIDDCRIEGAPEATRFDPAVHNHDGWRMDMTGAETATRAGRPLRVARRNEQSDLDRVAYGTGLAGSKAVGETTLGRWPANVTHDGSDEVLAAFPSSNGAAAPVKGTEPSATGGNGIYGHFDRVGSDAVRGDNGSSARFFYTSKADAADRLSSKHPTVKPVDLMRWLIRLVTPPNGTVLDCFAGSGTTAMAAMAEGFNAVLIEREAEYVADIHRRLAHVKGDDTPLFATSAQIELPIK